MFEVQGPTARHPLLLKNSSFLPPFACTMEKAPSPSITSVDSGVPEPCRAHIQRNAVAPLGLCLVLTELQGQPQSPWGAER